VSTEILGTGKVVEQSMRGVQSSVDAYTGSLPWWKLPWRADDISSDMSGILKTTYGRDLERHLVFHTGRLAKLKADQDAEILRALTFETKSSFNSPLLSNSVEQLSASTNLTPVSLTAPISRRLSQLTAKSGSPLAHLHLRTQMLLLQAYGLSFGGMGAAWGGWVAGYAGEEVAVGAGALGLLAGMRWAAGRWERAKKKWGESWVRVNEGLERDLEAQVGDAVRNKVFAKTMRAADGLEALALKRQESIGVLSTELTDLQKELQQMGSRI